MERLVEVKLARVHILLILDRCYRLFPLIYISYDSEGVTLQGSYRRILATTTIPRDSFKSYEFRGKPLVLAIPDDLKKLSGRCMEIVILKIDSWRVKNVFKSKGVSYECISSYMYELLDHPQLDSGMGSCSDLGPPGPISFE